MHALMGACHRCDGALLPNGDGDSACLCCGAIVYATPPVRDHYDEPEDLTHCRACASAFVRVQPHQVYCSQRCQHRAGNRRSYQKRRILRRPVRVLHCAHCGAAFTTSDPRQIYCGDACVQRASRARRRSA